MSPSHNFGTGDNVKVEAKSQSLSVFEKSSALTIGMLMGAIGLIIGSLLPGGYGGRGFIIGFVLGFALSSASIIKSESKHSDNKASVSEYTVNETQCPVCGTTLHLNITACSYSAKRQDKNES
jgi:hypothetical protein